MTANAQLRSLARRRIPAGGSRFHPSHIRSDSGVDKESIGEIVMKMLVLVALVLLAPAPAVAAPMVLAFSGADSFHSVSGQFSYDTSAKPFNTVVSGGASLAQYFSGSVSMLVDSRQWNIGGITNVSDAPAGSDVSDSIRNFANFSGSGRDAYSLTLNGASTMLNSSALPSLPLQISSGSFHWLCRDCNNFPDGSTIEFTIPLSFAAFAGSVPEPSTWGMMVLGMGAIGFAMRRRQRVSKRVSFA